MIRIISATDVCLIARDISANIHEKVGYLTELDSQLGDGDHGLNLERGFRQVVERLAPIQESDVGSILEMIGSTLLSSVGGATGPLYGTAFKRAGRSCRGKTEIGISEITQIFEAAEEGIMSIGGAKPGDKTILDALHPASEAARIAARRGERDLVRAFDEMVSAAELGLEGTKSLVAVKGRASYMKERGIGHYDVGAASFCIMLRSTLETLRRINKQVQNS